MKTLYKMSLSMLLLLLGVCLTSCHDTEASLMNKGRDSRLIGAWLLVETPGREVLSGDKAIVFEVNGACYGFHYKYSTPKTTIVSLCLFMATITISLV